MYRLHQSIHNTNTANARVVRALGPAAWFRFGQGITVTGAGVSQWDDQSGNGRHLKQGTDTNRPAKQADNSILFDGTDNYLKCDAFTLNQPFTVYLLSKIVVWGAAGDYICDGNSSFSTPIVMDKAGGSGVSPNVVQYAGSYGAEDLTNFTVGAYHSLAAVFNGASSVLQVDLNAAGTGNVGANNAGGFTLGSQGNGGGLFGNIQVKEVLLYAAAHNAGQRANVIAYLKAVGGI